MHTTQEGLRLARALAWRTRRTNVAPLASLVGAVLCTGVTRATAECYYNGYKGVCVSSASACTDSTGMSLVVVTA